MTDANDGVRRARYVLLTTFRKDGTPVPTPVWAADDDGRLLVWTSRKTGKVKRIRRDGRVTVAPCTVRGEPTGAFVEAQARLLDADGTAHTERALARKYRVLGPLFIRLERRRAGRDGMVGIAVDLPAER